ncbi:MAG TPA: CdaR family protein [Candidatus Edwardsbacteria bacterium]|nr:CdaR family protein [Candidatus Edwardsbacteria bacterium]
MRVPKMLRNIDIRIAALAMAVLLWFHAVTEREFRAVLRCPVTVRNIPEGWVLLNGPVVASCNVTATGKQLIALRLMPPRITIDAANRQVKRLSVDLEPSQLKYPFGVTPAQVEFTTNPLSVAFDRLQEKQVRVVADIRGEPAEGYLVGDSVSLTPPLVTVRGPQKALDQLDSLFTQPLPIDGSSRRWQAFSRLALPDNQGFAASPESVLVAVPLDKAGQRLFRNVPIKLVNRGSGYLVSFSPGTVDVVLAGPQPVLERTDASQISIMLDLKNLSRGRFRLQAVIELPPKLELLAANPRDFDVSIR